MSADCSADRFYSAAGAIVRTVWWLSWWLPPPQWARLRVYANGAADVCWSEGGDLFGFDDERYAGYFLSEDEYSQLESYDSEDEAVSGVRRCDLVPPEWRDSEDAKFKYYGTY